jgi:hypothetical protein
MRKQTHINIEIGGEGGKSSSPTLRHLLNSTCEISSVTSSHLTLQQHNAITRRVAPGRGGTRAAPWRAAKCCGNAIAPAGPRRVTERRKRRVACAEPFRTRAAAAQPQRRRGGGAAHRNKLRSKEHNGIEMDPQSAHILSDLSGHSRVTVGSQSGHSRVTVGSQSGHRFLYDFAILK